MADLTLGQIIKTARYQELPRFDAFGPLTMDCDVTLNLRPFNKTVRAAISDLIPFFQTGGGAQLATVVSGADIVYVVPDTVAAGTTTVSLPQLANKSFYLERGGFPMLIGTEYTILSSGGFQLVLAGDALSPGERFHLFVYELVGGSSSTSSGKALIVGSVNVPTNMSYDPVNHAGKLIRMRGGSTQITFTLPLIDDVPANTIIAIEATINNAVEQTVKSQGGQSIYFNAVGKTAVYMRPGDVFWFYRDTDGWYDLMGAIGAAYDSVGKIEDGYKAGLNQLVLNGQEVIRTDYPRLWQWVSSLGSSLVSEDTWQTASATLGGKTVPRPYRGCFSTGNGTSTFRLPDFMNTFLRTLKSETGTDAERFYNKAGGFQDEEFKAHSHDNDYEGNRGSGSTGQTKVRSVTAFPNQTGTTGGTETRPQNIGLLKIINC